MEYEQERKMRNNYQVVNNRSSKKYIFFTLLFLCIMSIYIVYSTIGSSKQSLMDLETSALENVINFNSNYDENVKFNIFMVETNHKAEYMSLRQMCSIESAALHNPEATIYVNVIKSQIGISKLFSKYKNIKWSLMNITEIFEDTPLLNWWKSDKLSTDDYFRFSHLSDALRLALIYKHGGFYSDMDHITIKNFQPLVKYSALINNNESVINLESSFFHLKKNHKFLKEAINEFANNYTSKFWDANGPKLLSRVIKSYCKTEKLNDLEITNKHKPGLNEVAQLIDTESLLCDIGILPFYIAYPYPYWEAKNMFKHNYKIEIFRFLNSFTIHFNSKITREFNVEINENSIIEFFMAHNCPLVYEQLKFQASSETNIHQSTVKLQVS